jgi:hypothetical protein
MCSDQTQAQNSIVARDALDKVPLQVTRGLATNLAHRARVSESGRSAAMLAWREGVICSEVLPVAVVRELFCPRPMGEVAPFYGAGAGPCSACVFARDSGILCFLGGVPFFETCSKTQRKNSIIARGALDKVPLQVTSGLATNLAHRARVSESERSAATLAWREGVISSEVLLVGVVRELFCPRPMGEVAPFYGAGAGPCSACVLARDSGILCFSGWHRL